MRKNAKAALAAGFVLTTIATVGCMQAFAQQAAEAGTPAATALWKGPSNSGLTEAPAAPMLNTGGCGTIQPQGFYEAAPAETSTSSVYGNQLEVWTKNLDQFRGKISEQTIDFLATLQRSITPAKRAAQPGSPILTTPEQGVAAPGAAIHASGAVSPAVF